MFVPQRINDILNTLNEGYDYKLIDELNNITVDSINLNIDITKLNSNYINFLGYCYENAKGTNINLQKAFELYTLAHERGNIYSTNNLAICYEKGKGTNINLQKAFELFTLAHERGNIRTTNNLAVCYKNGKGTTINLNKAIELYTLAHERGIIILTVNLANCYENGKGTTINLKHIKNNNIIKILTNKIPSDIIFSHLTNQIQTLHTLKDLGMYNVLSHKIMKYAY